MDSGERTAEEEAGKQHGGAEDPRTLCSFSTRQTKAPMSNGMRQLSHLEVASL